MRFLRLIGVLAALGLVGFFVLTRPASVDDTKFAGLKPDAAAGEEVFHAAGCASCHTAKDAQFSALPLLSGGQAFASDFGTFYAPNISPSMIGDWSVLEFANAVQKGVSPDGKHYYPAFPYVAYAKMTPQHVVNLKAYMDSLPASDVPNRAHDVGFPFSYRRALGGWKLLFGNDDWVMADAATPELERGRYLVEALAHCGECHTPRNALGGLKTADWLSGSVIPGEGKVPGITADQLGWVFEDISYYLESGFTPEFDSAGGAMAHVVENMAQLPASDRDAIAAYLLALP